MMDTDFLGTAFTWLIFVCAVQTKQVMTASFRQREKPHKLKTRKQQLGVGLM